MEQGGESCFSEIIQVKSALAGPFYCCVSLYMPVMFVYQILITGFQSTLHKCKLHSETRDAQLDLPCQ